MSSTSPSEASSAAGDERGPDAAPRGLRRLLAYRALWICLGFFLLVEIAVRVFPMEYGEGAGVFLTVHREKLLESSEPEFDYIVFGESKSMSLAGRPEGDWTLYNMSLPAMGSRYYTHYFEKYMRGREKKPAAVIFAGDPGVFQEHWSAPLHDPGRVYTDSTEESLGGYLWNRIVRRPGMGLAAARGGGGAPPEAVWAVFSHRFLNLFDFFELARQYTGPERVFILREALPLQYYTFRYRDAIRFTLSNPTPSAYDAPELPELCKRCDAIYLPECRPNLNTWQRNILIERRLDERGGQINLGDLLAPQEVLAYRMIREKAMQDQRANFDAARPDLRPLEELAKVTQEAGVKLIMAAAPTAEAYRGARFYELYDRELERLLKRYPHMTRIDFPTQHLPTEAFVDQVHYSCETARDVNAEWREVVLEQARAFAPPRG